METIIGIIIIAIIWGYYNHSINQKVENKNPLDVDTLKMIMDRCNGVSDWEIKRRYGDGYYDKRK